MGILDAVKELAGKIFTDGIKVAPEVTRQKVAYLQGMPALIPANRQLQKVWLLR